MGNGDGGGKDSQVWGKEQAIPLRHSVAMEMLRDTVGHALYLYHPKLVICPPNPISYLLRIISGSLTLWHFHLPCEDIKYVPVSIEHPHWGEILRRYCPSKIISARKFPSTCHIDYQNLWWNSRWTKMVSETRVFF